MNYSIKNQSHSGEGMLKANKRFTQRVRMGAALAAIMVVASVPYSAKAGTATTVTNYDYDAATGLVVAQTINPDTPQYSVKTTYTYDAFGNRLTTTVSSAATGLNAIASRTDTVAYDQYGLAPTSYTNSLGQLSNTQYDASNMPLYVESLNGLASKWLYDNVGRLLQETRPDGTSTTWAYVICNGGCGPIAPSTAQYSVTKRFFGPSESAPYQRTYYDALDRVVRKETLGFDGTSVILEDTEYDNVGRVLRTSRPYYVGQTIQWTTFTYDILSRVTDIVGPDGAHVHTDYNGLTTTVTNPLNQTKTTVKNSQGQLVQVTDANNNTLTYQYDANGNLIKTTDPVGNVTTIAYDPLNHRTTMTDPDLGTWNYVYDVLGELVQQTDPKGQVTTMNYDLRGRMTNRNEPDLKSTWTFDSCTMGKGQLCQVSADNGYAVTYTYDSLSRLSTTAATIGSAYSTTVTYDTAGRVATQSYPSGLTLKNVYTSLGYLSEVHNNATNALYWKANAMDAEQHLTQQTYGNNVMTNQVFDAATGRVKVITAGTNNTVQNLSYTYDQRGNMLTRADANQSLSETFLYDALNRLTTNTVNSGGAGVVTQIYGYDAIGNITSRSDVGTYTYGAVNNKPHAVASIAMNDGTTRQYTYDAVGNLNQEVQRDASSSVIAAKGRNETWTSFNMPLSLVNPSTTLTYVYGPDHQRIKMVNGGTTTIYLHPDNAGGLLYEKDIKADGTVEHRHFVNAGGSVVALIKQIGTGTLSVLYLHRDHLGSTTAVTNASGTVLERMSYEPFGKRRTPSGALDPNNTIVGQNTNRGFTNHEELDALELVHMNGRVYDPAIARFLSTDPGGTHDGDIQSYNRMAYVDNSPLILVDPTGFATSPASTVVVEGTHAVLPIDGIVLGFLGGNVVAQTGQATSAGGGASATGTAPPTQKPATKTKACKGVARVLQGNANLIGKSGGFDVSPSNPKLYSITSDSAAVIPLQFGLSKPEMRPYINSISGTLENGDGFNDVRDIMDDARTRRSKGMTTTEFQQYLISRETANNNGVIPLIVELPGIDKDLGFMNITVTVPIEMKCPQGTSE